MLVHDKSPHSIAVSNTRAFHAQGVSETVRLAFGVPLNAPCDGCMTPQHVVNQIRRFGEGQFVAIQRLDDGTEHVVGAAATMRTNYPPTKPPYS
jgi:hypothetical protein